ncbi:MAG: SDR family NAD(P)-dependent oxidoreductase, partial [Pseudomonadota bacterium]
MPTSRYPLALVTGTSSGIGEALARELMGRGWRVVGVARRPAQIHGPGYTHLQLDVADLAALTAALDTHLAALVADPAVTRLGLVNNAALGGLLGPISRLDATAMLEVYAVNT